MTNQHHPLLLVILDGWGHREETENNAIAAANKPTWDHLLATSTHTLISGSGKCVGLPDGQMGNSEVGHLNMGAGRIVHQDLTRIDAAIEDGSFFTNPVLNKALEDAKAQDKNVHILGLLSPGGVHSHEIHIQAMIKLAAQKQVPNLYVHAFLDGRDTPPRSALPSLKAIDELCRELSFGKVASIVGRYYAMDRDKRWERVKQAYQLLVEGTAHYQAATPEEALELAYARGETDEFVQATAIHLDYEPRIQIQDGDVVIFMNFRADRAREITHALIDTDFTGFKRLHHPQLSHFVCLTEYDKQFKTDVAFPPESLDRILAEVISKAHLKQLRIAETEKYAHVTFFFNGGIETPYPGEERLLIPSPQVATYDLQPEMSALPLTNKLVEAIKSQQYDVIICNYANPDMVGHTGDFLATVKAIETIDQCLSKVTQAIQEVGGECIITADHGNAEMMFDKKTNQPHTAHTNDPVPFIYLGRPAKVVKKDGKLSDIAPTMLYLLGMQQPADMTGKSIIEVEG